MNYDVQALIWLEDAISHETESRYASPFDIERLLETAQVVLRRLPRDSKEVEDALSTLVETTSRVLTKRTGRLFEASQIREALLGPFGSVQALIWSGS